MPNTSGLLLLAGVGALLFLGRGVPAKKLDEDKRFVGSNLGGTPLPPSVPAFNIQSYIDGLFGDPATVPAQPPMQLFFPASRTVTSSGVPGPIRPPPDIVTPTTKVQIGGDGGETIVASSLAVVRSEQIAKQRFAAAANVQPRTWAATVAANKIAEDAQRKFAQDLIAKNRAAQLQAAARSRAVQEAVLPVVASVPPTINFYSSDDDWTMNPFSTPGQAISVTVYAGEEDDDDYQPSVFAGEEDDSDFVISGGMDSPTVFAGEEDDIQFSMEPSQSYYGAYGGEE